MTNDNEVLMEFIINENGKALVRQAAKKLGWTQSKVLVRIKEEPKLDFLPYPGAHFPGDKTFYLKEISAAKNG